jgi:hypothetical protein
MICLRESKRHAFFQFGDPRDPLLEPVDFSLDLLVARFLG